MFDDGIGQNARGHVFCHGVVIFDGLAQFERVHRLIANYTRQNRQNVALCTVRFTPLKHGRYKLHAANAGAIPPLLRRAKGADDKTIQTLLIDNPRRAFAYA